MPSATGKYFDQLMHTYGLPTDPAYWAAVRHREVIGKLRQFIAENYPHIEVDPALYVEGDNLEVHIQFPITDHGRRSNRWPSRLPLQLKHQKQT